ncbi:MAG: HAMP domain-containing sensor histidine kinase [Bacteroidales bacterium]
MSAKNQEGESYNPKNAFLLNISHEIRTPLNAVIGFSELLLRPGLPKEKLADYVELIKTNSMKLLSVINDLIEISKIESGQLTFCPESFDINYFLNRLYIRYKKTAESKNLKLFCLPDRPNSIILLKSDKNRIETVLCHLLNNAIKFTGKGHIRFGYHIKDKFIEFYVEDTGIGIAAENLELIFKPFGQLENIYTREYSGNGLGLSISKALIEKMGGAVSVESIHGKGSTFSFTVPHHNYNSKLKPKSNRSIGWNKKSSLISEKIKKGAMIDH